MRSPIVLTRLVPKFRARPAAAQVAATLLAGALACGPALATPPDLVVTAVDPSPSTTHPQTLVLSGSVSVTIENLGTDPAAGAFTLLLFEDRNFNGAYDPGVDLVLGSTIVADLAGGSSATGPVPVAGTVLFRGNLIYAFVDANQQIAESNESNNLSNSGLDCQIGGPTPPAFEPVLEWHWPGAMTIVAPDAINVMMTPAVIDLNGDLIPDVVFASTSSTSGAGLQPGILRAISGIDGAPLFSVTDPAFAVNASTSLAVGDIDGDGKPEIIAAAASGLRLLAFEHDGTPKVWPMTAIEQVGVGAIAIANLDGAGLPEIIVGRQALGADGMPLWTGTGGTGSNSDLFPGPISVVADLDLDDRPEVIAGNTAYRAQTVGGQWVAGSIYWQNTGVPDGLVAIGNFDADANPEVVLVAKNNVYMLEHDGALKWGPVPIPGAAAAGGPPTIADFDGDGAREIGVAGRTRYTVYRADGSTLWSVPIQDISSSVTGSSVFDFNGDGVAEVVYRDETTLHVFRGPDGVELAVPPLLLSSCTWQEYPLVADVDGDGHAELIVVANNNCGYGTQRGIFVYGGKNASWVATRALWNQHSYHITNINDDSTIPPVENDNWLFPVASPFNNYRQNLFAGGQPPTAAPDLTASLIRFACGPAASAVVARIGNGGAANAGVGIPVSFYDGNPAAAGVLLGTTPTVTVLPPGQFEEVAFVLPAGFDVNKTIFVVADDSGGLVSTREECDETNNVHSGSVSVCGPSIVCPPDVSVDCASSLDPAITGAATGTSVCDPAGLTVTFADAIGAGVPVIVNRTWTATTSCGQAVSCLQRITLLDSTPPVVTCPPTAAVSCSGSTAPPATGQPVVVDDCDPAPTVSFTDVETPGACAHAKVIQRTWTATDRYGNSASCAQTINVFDNTAPTITCPVDFQLDCTLPIDPGTTGAAVAVDDCDPQPQVTFVDLPPPPGAAFPKVTQRTWTATDACGNSVSCVQNIVQVDHTPPVVTCPPDRTLALGSSIAPAATGVATAVDACDPVVTITSSDNVTAGACPGQTVVLRTWTATDSSGNSASCVQKITRTDLVPPSITCPPDATVECGESTDPAATGSATAVDDSGLAVTITFSDSVSQEGAATVITRTWKATDACGNGRTCAQRIVTPPDDTPPVITSPAVVEVDLVAAGGVPSSEVPLSATASDACGVTVTDDRPEVYPPGETTVTFTARDPSGNVSTSTTVVRVRDAGPPTITCPADVVLEATTAQGVPVGEVPLLAQASDLSGIVTITDDRPAAFYPVGTTVVTFTARDAAGNTVACTTRVTVTPGPPAEQADVFHEEIIVVTERRNACGFPTLFPIFACAVGLGSLKAGVRRGRRG